jgi:hypothetical protein
MYKPLYLLFAVMVIVLGACSLPASVDPIAPTATLSPSAVSPSDVPTEEPVLELRATQGVSETATILPTETQEAQEPTPTIEATAQLEAKYRYSLQIGTPVQTANFLLPEAGCDWMGVGGQVFSRNDRPIGGLIVEVGGTLDGLPVLYLSMTGDSTALGPGGYEIKLADQPVASQGTLWLQLHDLNGTPQSERIYFDTYSGEGECENNLIIINFRELRTEPLDYYLPSIFRGP